MQTSRSILSALCVLCLALSGCPSAVCDEGETQCEGEQIQTCSADGEWGEAADCSEMGESCMTMDDGMQHCMADM